MIVPEIFSSPFYWTKNTLSVGILDTRPYRTLTSERYRELVEEGIDIWNRTLEYNGQTPNYSNLSSVRFTLTSDYDNADVQIYWWFSSRMNGLTNTMFDQNHVAISSKVMIAKNQGPNVPVMPQENTVLSPVPVVRNEDQIRSIVVHELGHVLGLEHTNFSKDLMKTGTVGQPDPNRRISNIDLELVNNLFTSNVADRINHTCINRIFSDVEWTSVQK